MNPAAEVLQAALGAPGGPGGETGRLTDALADDFVFTFFDERGQRLHATDKAAFLAFATRAAALMSTMRDQTLTIVPFGEQCAFLSSRGERVAKANGERTSYEWAIMVRAKDGRLTCATDMLDHSSADFWARSAKAADEG